MIIRVVARLSGAARIPWGWDDAFVVVAWVFASPLAVVAGWLSEYGLRRDIWYFPMEHPSSFFVLVYVEGIFYVTAAGLVKIVLLTFYLKIFPSQAFQRATWSMIFLTTSWTIAITLVALFQYKPIEFVWQRWDLVHDSKCVDYEAFALSQASLNLLFDLVILLMPMPTLYRLHIST